MMAIPYRPFRTIYRPPSSRVKKSKKNASHISVSGLYSETYFNKAEHFSTNAILPSTVVYCCQFLLRFVTSHFAVLGLHKDSVESIKLWIATGRIIVRYSNNINVIECSLIPLEQNRSWLQRRQAQCKALWSTSYLQKSTVYEILQFSKICIFEEVNENTCRG